MEKVPRDFNCNSARIFIYIARMQVGKLGWRTGNWPPLLDVPENVLVQSISCNRKRKLPAAPRIVRNFQT